MEKRDRINSFSENKKLFEKAKILRETIKINIRNQVKNIKK